MGSYRSRLDIIADILRAVSQNAKKTQIMYQANLSFQVLQKYLSEVSDALLIEFNSQAQCYVLTDKGRAFLEAYKEYSRDYMYLEKRMSEIESKRKILESLCSRK
ncbi:MAG: winged helix-turn-helix domain-containing protein [Candidatus Bathyarchaeota archaeon]|nr:winged helix-turn-helix domain-containing protein [Candidatus Bathyarchaeota archaeon]